MWANAEKMHRLGIKTGANLKSKSLQFLTENFGKSGPYFYGIARGIDEPPVRPDRVTKPIGAEDTLVDDTDDLALATTGWNLQRQKAGRIVRQSRSAARW